MFHCPRFDHVLPCIFCTVSDAATPGCMPRCLLVHSWKKLWCFLLIAIPCQTLPQTAFEMGNGLKLSPSFLFLPFFHHLYSDNVRQAGLQTNSQSIQQASIYSRSPDSHAMLEALLIPDDLPDWHLQHLYQCWRQVHFSHHYPTTVSESAVLPGGVRNTTRKDPEHRIYLSLINQQFRIVIQPSFQLPMPMQAVLAERTLNTLQYFYQLVLDKYDLSDTLGQVVSSAAGSDGGDDDPYHSTGRGKFDVFVYQPDTGWQSLFQRLHRQGLSGQSIRKKQHILTILQQQIRQAIHSGHEQIARILQNRIMMVEVDLDELLYQVNSQGTGFYSNEAPVVPLLQNLLRQTGTLEQEQEYFDMYFSPPEDGGGEGQSKKKTTSQYSQQQDKQGKRAPKDDEAPPEKKYRQQSDDGGGGRGDSASDTLSKEQLLANIPYQLQLDIAWEFKDEIDLFGQVCAVAEDESARRETPYIRAFIFISKCIAVHKIESTIQLVRLVRRLSRVGKAFEERLVRVIREYREESIPIEGEYSDFYSFLSLKTFPFLPRLSISVVTGLHLGLSLEQMQKVERNSYKARKLDIFNLYKEEHPRTLLARFFPLIKKALSRIGKPEWYDEIYTAFTTSVSRQENSKHPLTGQEYQSADGKTEIPQSRYTTFEKSGCLQPVIVCSKYLPAEIWVHIFSFMDLDTLSTCRLVCKTFYVIADNPTLMMTNPVIADCINKGQYLDNDIDKERVEKSFWFHSTDWLYALADRKTHPEIIRRCISHPCFLAGYLWKEQCLLKIRLLVTGKPDHDIRIDQIASNYNQHAPNPQDRFSVVIRSGTSIVHLISDRGCHTRTCTLKQDNSGNPGDRWYMNGDRVWECMPYPGDAIVLDNLGLFLRNCPEITSRFDVTFAVSVLADSTENLDFISGLFLTFEKKTLHTWNTSKPETECLQGVIRHINCVAVMKKKTSHTIVTDFIDKECCYLQSYEIQRSSSGCIAAKSESIAVPYCVLFLRTMHNQTKLIVLDHLLYLSAWEFNTEGLLHNTVKPRQLRGVGEDQEAFAIYFPSVSFGDTLYGVVNDNSVIGFNYNFDITFVFKANPFAFCFCVDIGVIDDNILILATPKSIQLFRCDKDGKKNPLMIHRLNSEITTMTVLDKNHLLLGFKNGEVSLYFLPFLPSFTAFPHRLPLKLWSD